MKMRLLVSAVFLFVITALSCVDQQRGAVVEQESLVGYWRVTTLTTNGTASQTGKGYTISFRAETFEATVFSQHGSDGSYSLNADEDPKWIDLWLILDEDEKPQHISGIYTVSKGTAKICFASSKTRPTTFAAEKGDGNTLLILERIDDGDDVVADLHGVGIQE